MPPLPSSRSHRSANIWIGAVAILTVAGGSAIAAFTAVGRRRYEGENGYKTAKKPAVAAKRRRAPACSFASLGPAVWQWIADHLLVPDGPHAAYSKPISCASRISRPRT